MAGLSKSRLMSYLQCPRRLWLEKHRPDLARVSAATQAAFDTGHEIGDVARHLYDPEGTGTLVGMERGMSGALRATRAALERPDATPLFEATFERAGLLVRTDVLDRARGRLIEVKASTAVKDEHVTDCAIQSWVLESSAARPAEVLLAHVDNRFTYRGDGDYRGLLVEQDLTAAVAPLRQRVPEWLDGARRALAGAEPDIRIGSRCRTPYECPFTRHCWPQTDYPLTTLPGIGRRLDQLVAAGYTDIRDLPEERVGSGDALRAWRAARSGEPVIDGSAWAALAALGWPRYYLDFETINPAVPLWAGTRPYQQVPFQWSLHVERESGAVDHAEFLDLSGELPARAAATALIEATGSDGPVLTYTAFEKMCLDTLAELCPDLPAALQRLGERLIDLHPIVKASYYHPAMKGSWSIKALLPTLAPDMDYARLDGVRAGGEAQQAFREAIAPGTTAERHAELREQLLRYCAHDTLAMVRIAGFLAAA
ncbi:MAG: DUF2779 domain-containing protein [Gammaproteobacteria bacterium]|nr:DUF2779 domain-containing protein [Gammaproteobacteria bacterium]